MPKGKEVRGAFRQGSAHIALDGPALIRGPVECVRVARIKNRVAESEGRGPMKLARTRPGKNLNVAKADAFVLRRKWILINYDLADRLLVGQDRAGGESIDEDLRSTWSGRRTGESVQLRLKLI